MSEIRPMTEAHRTTVYAHCARKTEKSVIEACLSTSIERDF